MGLGPNGTSLLTKLNIKSLAEMTTDELRELVSSDRFRRSSERALGRAKRIMGDKKPRVVKVTTLESVGLNSSLITKLRLTGKPDEVIIAELRQKGII
jgi:hypothetical protein